MNAFSFKRCGYAWVTLGFFLLSLVAHWVFGWMAYTEEQHSEQRPVEVRAYVMEMARDMFENWQSEFLQLLWQVGGLALLLHVGSPQSKEGDDRKEEKIDLILHKLDAHHAKEEIRAIDRKYFRHA